MLPTLPPAPTRTDPVNFSNLADAWVAALDPWTVAANALESNMQFTATTGTSTTSKAIAIGSWTLTTQTNKGWVVGSYVYIVAASDVTKLMLGQITAYNSSTGSLTVNITTVKGSGTYNSWTIGLGTPDVLTVVPSLTVSQASGHTYLNITTGSSSDAGITFKTGGSVSGSFVGTNPTKQLYLWNYENFPVLIGTNNTTVITVTGAGDVGISNSTPGTKLDVSGGIRSQIVGGVPIIYLNNGTTQHSISNISNRLVFRNSDIEYCALNSNGNFEMTSTSKLGYGGGSGGTVIQSVNKSTAVTLNKTSGSIQLHNQALAANAVVTFPFNNSTIQSDDILLLQLKSGATAGAYIVDVYSKTNGVAYISVKNISAASLSEAIVISFVIIKGSTA